MKKFLRAISLLLVVVMTMATVPAFAAEASAEAAYTLPANVENIWYAGEITAKQFGFDDKGITEGEYTPIFTDRTAPVAYLNTYTAAQIEAGTHQNNAEGGYNSAYDDVVADDFYSADKKKRVSQEMDFYVSYDDEYIYIAFTDVAAAYDFDGDGEIGPQEYAFRSNYNLRIGTNLADTTNYLNLTDSDLGYLKVAYGVDAQGSCTTIPNGLLHDVQITKKSVDGTTCIPANDNFKLAQGGASIVDVELKIAKNQLLLYSNQYLGTDYAELPNVLFINFCEKTYFWGNDAESSVGSNIESMWVGSKTGDETAGSHDWDWAFDAVVLGAQGTEIKVPAAAATLTGHEFVIPGQRVHYTGRKSTVTMDGYVAQDEYKLNYNLQAPSLWMTTDSYLAVRDTTYTKDRLSSEEMTFSFAHDDDNIYIAFTDVGGHDYDNYKDPLTAGNSFRCNYHYRLGFNLGDENVFIQFGAGGSVANVAVKYGTDSAGAATWGNSSVTSNAFVVSNPITKYEYDYRTNTIGGLLNTTGGNSDTTPYIEYSELAINKAKLLDVINSLCGTNYAELPNVMQFTMVERSYWRCGPDAANSQDGGYTYKYANYALDTAWMATASAGSAWGYIPDVVVFGEEGAAVEAPCNFNVKLEDDTTLMATCTSPDLYYYTCACGQAADGSAAAGGYLSYFKGTADVAADHTPNIPEATENDDKICTQCLTVLAEHTGHAHAYGDSYATDGTQHWKECACGAKGMLGAHTGTPCTACGYGASAPVTPPAQTEPEDTTPPATEPEDTTPPATEPEDTTPPATEPEDTTPPATEPEDTTPEETTPEETTPVESESEAETEPADDNCNNTISVMGLALVAALGACGVVATKKKED